MRPTASRLLGFTCLASLAAVAAALVSQYQFGMAPCPWCILQRVIFVLMALLSGLAWAVTARGPRRVLAGLTAAAAGSGIAAAVYQHTVAAQSFSCSLTLADKIIQALRLEQALPFVFGVKASCADAAATLLGLPYEYWSLGLYALLLIACVVVLVRPRP